MVFSQMHFSVLICHWNECMVQKAYNKEAVNYEFQCIVEVLVCVSTKQLPQNYIFTYIVSQV